jgi:hypothetical protein
MLRVELAAIGSAVRKQRIDEPTFAAARLGFEKPDRLELLRFGQAIKRTCRGLDHVWFGTLLEPTDSSVTDEWLSFADFSIKWHWSSASVTSIGPAFASSSARRRSICSGVNCGGSSISCFNKRSAAASRMSSGLFASRATLSNSSRTPPFHESSSANTAFNGRTAGIAFRMVARARAPRGLPAGLPLWPGLNRVAGLGLGLPDMLELSGNHLAFQCAMQHTDAW